MSSRAECERSHQPHDQATRRGKHGTNISRGQHVGSICRLLPRLMLPAFYCLAARMRCAYEPRRQQAGRPLIRRGGEAANHFGPEPVAVTEQASQFVVPKALPRESPPPRKAGHLDRRQSKAFGYTGVDLVSQPLAELQLFLKRLAGIAAYNQGAALGMSGRSVWMWPCPSTRISMSSSSRRRSVPIHARLSTSGFGAEK
jgi:hypothetical protein